MYPARLVAMDHNRKSTIRERVDDRSRQDVDHGCASENLCSISLVLKRLCAVTAKRAYMEAFAGLAQLAEQRYRKP